MVGFPSRPTSKSFLALTGARIVGERNELKSQPG